MHTDRNLNLTKNCFRNHTSASSSSKLDYWLYAITGSSWRYKRHEGVTYSTNYARFVMGKLCLNTKYATILIMSARKVFISICFEPGNFYFNLDNILRHLFRLMCYKISNVQRLLWLLTHVVIYHNMFIMPWL